MQNIILTHYKELHLFYCLVRKNVGKMKKNVKRTLKRFKIYGTRVRSFAVREPGREP